MDDHFDHLKYNFFSFNSRNFIGPLTLLPWSTRGQHSCTQKFNINVPSNNKWKSLNITCALNASLVQKKKDSIGGGEGGGSNMCNWCVQNSWKQYRGWTF